jgi:hypothetical protein
VRHRTSACPPDARRGRRPKLSSRVGTVGVVLALGFFSVGAPPARAVGPPLIAASWVEKVTATSAQLHAEINPNSSPTKSLFEYIDDAALAANRAAGREDFFGAARKPNSPSGNTSGSVNFAAAPQNIEGLRPATVYRYRVVAENALGRTPGPAHDLLTQEPTSTFHLLAGRVWEMVSPVDKNGGSIQAPGQSFAGGVFQAAAAGGGLTYSSAAVFGPDPQGAPAASQYLARRGAGAWSVENIATPQLSGSYGDRPDGVPYQLFSGDLSRGLLSNGERCRGSGEACPVANPPLPGSGAPSGYVNYYLRDNLGGGFSALLREADVAGLALGPAQFELRFAGASPDLAHVALSTCAALTPAATEVGAAGGCDPAEQNLYERSGGGLSLLNVRPGESASAPGAALAAQGGAVSSDGSRVYWTEGGDLYLRENAEAPQSPLDGAGSCTDAAAACTFLVSEGGQFEVASTNGSVALFSKGGHLYRYAAAKASSDIVPGGGVQGVLGASADGSYVYYLSAAGLFLWHGGATSKVAAGAAAGNYPPTTGTARVTPDGRHLVFVSSAELTEFDSFGLAEVFLYGPRPGGAAASLTCVSCNPAGERPNGPASIPGAIANGTGPAATDVYKPRALSGDGSHVFFDSGDALAIQDTNKKPDVYEWEAGGVGGCARSQGCVGLVSSGRSPEASSFVDASADGVDVFFLTESSLVAQDPGSYDLYDARAGGGLPQPPAREICVGDKCQPLPAPPDDPTPGTLVANGGNPPLRFVKPHKKRSHKKKHRRGGRSHKQSQRLRGGGR